MRINPLVKARGLLLTQPPDGVERPWGREIDSSLRTAGVVVYRTLTHAEAIGRIEEGGLSAAVLVEQRDAETGADVFTLLRIIRAIDEALPCWLVTRTASRRSLERALDLRVRSIVQYAAGLDGLLQSLHRELCAQPRD